ncbi:MAG: hypothetical protein WA632_01925, partial [Gallionella sp.]
FCYIVHGRNASRLSALYASGVVETVGPERGVLNFTCSSMIHNYKIQATQIVLLDHDKSLV